MTKRILFWSLLANVLLVAALVWSLRLADRGDKDLRATTPAATAETASPTGPVATGAPAPDVLAGDAGALRWAAVENEDLATYMTNLGELGLPEQIVHAIIRAEIDRRYEQRFQSLSRLGGAVDFWRTGPDFTAQFIPSGDDIRRRDALLAEKRDLLVTLLGSDAERRIAHEIGLRERVLGSMLDFLPAEKKDAVAGILREYQAREVDNMRSAARSDSHRLAQDREAAIANVLGPAEYELYLLTMSDTAMRLRSNLVGFEPNEAEFREIFALVRQFDNEHNGDTSADTAAASRQERREGMQAQIRATLGESRYADYQRSQDHRYRGLYEVARAEDLDTPTIQAVYDLLQEAGEQARGIASTAELSDDEKHTRLESLRSNARANAHSLWSGRREDSQAMRRFEQYLDTSTRY